MQPDGLVEQFRHLHSHGRKILVPYVTGGIDHWQDAIRSVAAHGADAIEVGIPFSDPVMDGPVIQRASQRALQRGTTVAQVLDGIREIDAGKPILVMCYYNTVFRAGHERFASQVAAAGVEGVIIPDLPLEEAMEWCRVADTHGVATIMLAAPTASDERLRRIVARSRAFVYSVGLLGVTGERDALAQTATALAARVKALTDLPTLVGVGVSNGEQAREACSVADGVIMGASVMRRLMDEGVEATGRFIGEVRHAIDD